MSVEKYFDTIQISYVIDGSCLEQELIINLSGVLFSSVHRLDDILLKYQRPSHLSICFFIHTLSWHKIMDCIGINC